MTKIILINASSDEIQRLQNQGYNLVFVNNDKTEKVSTEVKIQPKYSSYSIAKAIGTIKNLLKVA